MPVAETDYTSEDHIEFLVRLDSSSCFIVESECSSCGQCQLFLETNAKKKQQQEMILVWAPQRYILKNH